MPRSPARESFWYRSRRLLPRHPPDSPEVFPQLRGRARKSSSETKIRTLMPHHRGNFKPASTRSKSNSHGKGGIGLTDLLPYRGPAADDLCVIRSLHSEPINHDPAVPFMQTGRPQPGLPCMGSWLSYGLGSENRDLPAFVAMISGPMDQPVHSRYYHSGFLPGQHQGTYLQATSEPVL